MPDADTLRVQVRINRLEHPELHAVASALPLRARAERLRQLALLGLRVPTIGVASAAAEQAAPNAPESTTDPCRRQLLASLSLAD